MIAGKRLSMCAAAAIALAAGVANAGIITQWDFNSVPDDGTFTTGTTSPAIGTGAAALLGGVTATFASGNSNGGSTDPVADNNDSGWQTTGYPASQTGSGTAGTGYMVSTVGYQDIVVTYDLRHSNTSSRYEQLQYTLDGSTYTSAGLPNDGVFDGNAGDTWFNLRTADLSAIVGANDNPNFGFKIVAVFAPGGADYAASSTTYASSGTWRFDMVTVSGNAIPEPASLGLIALPAMAILARRRRSA